MVSGYTCRYGLLGSVDGRTRETSAGRGEGGKGGSGYDNGCYVPTYMYVCVCDFDGFLHFFFGETRN